MKESNKNMVLSEKDSKQSEPNYFQNITLKPTIVLHPKCKVCNSANRHQAEDIFQKTRNLSQTHRWLEQQGEKLSWSCVRHHMQSHLSVSEINEKVEDYCQSMISWCEKERKKEQRLDALISILERRIIQIASIIDGRDDDAALKMTDTLIKLIGNILDVQSQMDDYKKVHEPVKIVIDKIQQIVQVQLSATPSQEVRKVLMNVVDVLENDLGGLIENGQN
jgi:hypothetical protein